MFLISCIYSIYFQSFLVICKSCWSEKLENLFVSFFVSFEFLSKFHIILYFNLTSPTYCQHLHTYRLVYSPSPITPSNSIFILLFLFPLPLQFSPLSLFPPNSRFVPFSLFLSHIPILPPLSSFFSIPFPLLLPHNLTLTLLSFPPSHFLPFSLCLPPTSISPSPQTSKQRSHILLSWRV